jgi:hypothetical protein
MPLVICSKTGVPCRHCSDEITKVITRTGDSVKGIRRTETITPLGQFCNNDGRHFVRDLPACPVPSAVSVPLVPFELSKKVTVAAVV